VANFDGIELESRATTFRGGSMVAWFGGIVTSTSARPELAPGARLSAGTTLFGGHRAVTDAPPGWRVESSAKALMGRGKDARGPPAADDPEAPVLQRSTALRSAARIAVWRGTRGRPARPRVLTGRAFG
jgi:hypothetical protein